MARYSLLTMDLNNLVPTEKRETFYSELRDRKWHKIDALTTVWIKLWTDASTDEGILNTAESQIKESANEAGITHYDAGLVIGGQPVFWRK